MHHLFSPWPNLRFGRPSAFAKASADKSPDKLAHPVMHENAVIYRDWFGLGIAIGIGIGFLEDRLRIPMPIPIPADPELGLFSKQSLMYFMAHPEIHEN